MTAPRRREDAGVRLEIQALRACAAMAVVLYHFWPGRLPGGYVGVDVFSVISGFLITGHLLRELETTGGVRLARFWARRARRLLPGSYLVIVAGLLATFALLPVVRWPQNLAELAASTLYVENWRLAHDAVDYLASANEPSVVQHFWTLGVEEQFYLLWPLGLLLVHRLAGPRKRAGITLAVAAVSAASFALSVWLTATRPSWAYFVTPGRIWEFGVGALLALALARGRLGAAGTDAVRPAYDRWRGALSWVGLLALGWTVVSYDDATPFPGAAALLPTLATALVIACGMPTARLSPAPLLALRPVQWVGDVSYAVYLWHWPLIVLAPVVLGREPGLVARLVLLGLTLLLAELSTRYVETPFRRHQRVVSLRPGPTVLLAGVASVALVLPSLVGLRIADARAARADAAADALVASSPECFGAASMDLGEPCHNPELDDELVPSPANVRKDLDYPGCMNDYDGTAILDCQFGPAGRRVPHVLLVGDSHAQMFLPSLRALAEQGVLRVSAQLKAACPWASPPASRRPSAYAAECSAFRTNLQRWLADHAREFDLVLTTGRMDNLPGALAEQQRDLAEAWRVVADQGVPVAAIVDNPRWRHDPNECLSRLGPGQIHPRACGQPRSRLVHVHDPQPGAAGRVGGHVIDLTDLYCHDGWCPAVAGGVNMYRDYSHLSLQYAVSLGPYLYRRLVAAGLLSPR